VVHANNSYVVVGYYGTIVTSSDAVNWTVQFTDTPHALLSVTAGNGLFVATGQGGTILTSGNGIDWNPRASGTSLELSSATFANGQFLVAGASGLLTSSDGMNWIRRNLRTNLRVRGVAYLNGTYWLVGDNGAILESGAALPLRLSGQWQADPRSFELRSTGGRLDETYRLQVCTSVGSDWSDLAILTNSSTGMYFLDRDAGLRSSCFYRLASP
jgi:hypothetical protein